jgi:hypothetical protein
VFTLSGKNLPRVRSFQDAAAVYDRSFQAKHFDSNQRGLSSKRDTSKTIFAINGGFKFRYHHTDMVMWFPEEVRVVTFDSLSSVVFANSFLPYGLHTFNHRREMYVADKYGSYQAKDGGPLRFTLVNGEWRVNPENVRTWETFVLNHKRAGQIRKTLKPFMDWKISIERMKGERASVLGQTHSRAIECLKQDIQANEIPVEHYADLLAHGAGEGTNFMEQCYVLGGAVSKSQSEFGKLRSPSKYQGLSAWSWVNF